MAFRIEPGAPLHAEVIRLGQAAADEVAGLLDPAVADPAAGFHGARKALKRLRALLRLVRSAAPEELKAIERGFRDAARELAGAREAAAMVETLERFIADHPDRIVDCRLGEIRAHLLRRAPQRQADAAAAAARARMACLAAAGALPAVTFAAAGDAAVLAVGMERTLDRWREAARRARRRGDAEDFHDLRKAVKAHAAQAALLRDFRRSGDGRRDRLDALGDDLGALNDIHVMLHALRHDRLGLPGKVGTRGFARLLRRKARRLTERCLAEAEALLADAPAGLRRDLRKAGERARAA